MYHKLEALIDSLKEVTGLEICVFDLSFFNKELPQLRLETLYRSHCSRFCTFIKSIPGLQPNRCIPQELERIDMVRKKGETIIHTCYAGVTEMITPIHLGERLVGAVFLGQIILNDPNTENNIKNLAEETGIELHKFQSEYQQQRESLQVLKKYQILSEFLAQQISLILENNQLRKLDSPNSEPRNKASKLNMQSIPNPFLNEIRSRTHSKLLQSLLDMLKLCYWESRNLGSFARGVGASESKISRLFKQETGMSFRQVIKKARIVAAAYILKKYDVNISEAGYEVGYQNFFAFSRAFKQVMKMTPSEYREGQSLPL